jgi:hypothetical protein
MCLGVGALKGKCCSAVYYAGIKLVEHKMRRGAVAQQRGVSGLRQQRLGIQLRRLLECPCLELGIALRLECFGIELGAAPLAALAYRGGGSIAARLVAAVECALAGGQVGMHLGVIAHPRAGIRAVHSD